MIVGKAIYLQFETVINLTQQWQIPDSRWMEILQNTRQGECTHKDIEEIQKLVIAKLGCKILDFKKAPWNNVVVVTPQNAVHTAWNRVALHKHCAETGNLPYVFDAEDSVSNACVPLNMQQKFIAAGMKADDRNRQTGTKRLKHRLEVAMGMKIMVTLNLAIEANLANGS